MGFIALIAGTLQYFFNSDNFDLVIGIIFGFINVQWVSLMVSEWSKDEKFFAAKVG